jgi:hypothetical protein
VTHPLPDRNAIRAEAEAARALEEAKHAKKRFPACCSSALRHAHVHKQVKMTLVAVDQMDEGFTRCALLEPPQPLTQAQAERFKRPSAAWI